MKNLFSLFKKNKVDKKGNQVPDDTWKKIDLEKNIRQDLHAAMAMLAAILENEEVFKMILTHFEETRKKMIEYEKMVNEQMKEKGKEIKLDADLFGKQPNAQA